MIAPRLAVVLAAVLLVLSACGGGGSDDDRESLTGPDWDVAYAVLPRVESLPAGFLAAGGPHSEGGVDSGSPIPNASIQFEVADAPTDPATVSCVDFWVAKLSTDGEAHTIFKSDDRSPDGTPAVPGQVIRSIDHPAIGDASFGSSIVSPEYPIGTCGTRPVYASISSIVRRGSFVTTVTGFSAANPTSSDLVFEFSRMMVERIDAEMAR